MAISLQEVNIVARHADSYPRRSADYWTVKVGRMNIV